MREHPLTARVAVNRVWQMLFGAGLVRTPADFGAQGEYPTHPELLDSLAVDFMDHGWDTKRLVRQIVTSATYRQSSTTPNPALLEVDPAQPPACTRPAIPPAGRIHSRLGTQNQRPLGQSPRRP